VRGGLALIQRMFFKIKTIVAGQSAKGTYRFYYYALSVLLYIIIQSKFFPISGSFTEYTSFIYL